MNKTTSTILGAIAGAAAGTVIGILFAPDKGSNTRDRLTYRLARYRERLEDLLDDLVETKNLPDSAAKSESQKVISDAKVKAEKLLEDVDDLIGQIREQK